MKPKIVVLAFALTNAILYCCVLPLWEGFDEPFHYAYIETLSLRHRFPVLNHTPISSEIGRSLTLVPLSWLFSAAIPGSISFEDWSRLNSDERSRKQDELRRLSGELRRSDSTLLNYEAQQAPLAYLLLAPVDAFRAQLTLAGEMLLLRLFGAIAATLLIYFAVNVLLSRLGVSDGFALAVLICVFESQMLWASVAHVGNDWLAIALTVCFLAALAVTAQERRSTRALLLSAIFAAGLLTKAYFLAFTPVWAAMLVYLGARRLVPMKTTIAALAIPVLIAMPWYVHNLFLYDSFSATQQSVAGVGLRQAVSALTRINWLASAAEFARWSLWTGNWSFTAFSRNTLNFELLLLLAAFATYVAQFRGMRQAELWVLAACGCFLLGLIYQTCVTWVHTHGVSTHPEPWYGQGVIACLWVLCAMGLETANVAGRIVAIALCLVSAWIAELTYVAKLLPYYGGMHARSTWHTVWNWWQANPEHALQAIVLAPVPMVYALLGAFSIMLAAVTALAVYRLRRS